MAGQGAVPAYLLDREQQSRSKVLSNTVKQKRKEKAVRIFIILYIDGQVSGQPRASGVFRSQRSVQLEKTKFLKLSGLEKQEVKDISVVDLILYIK